MEQVTAAKTGHVLHSMVMSLHAGAGVSLLWTARALSAQVATPPCLHPSTCNRTWYAKGCLLVVDML
jgi:hypothetical protein